jgi:hypothetical protein
LRDATLLGQQRREDSVLAGPSRHYRRTNLRRLLKALNARNYDQARMLIDRGANVTLGTDNGITPLLLTYLRAAPGDREMEQLLRAKEASLNPIMVAKWTAFKWTIGAAMSRGYA